MSFFDDFLARVPAEDQAILNKYPELKASVLKMETDLDTTARYAGGWVNWQKENWDPQAGMTKREKELLGEINALNASLAAGPSAAGPSAQTLEALRKELEAKIAGVGGETLKAVEGMNHFYRSMSAKILTHNNEFKETLDPQRVMEYMQQNKIIDPDLAYDRMVAGKRADNAANAQKELDAKHAADLAEAEKRGYEKRAQEAAMGPSGMSPTDQTGGIAGVTAHVAADPKMSDAVKSKMSEAKLGDGSLAALGYEMYRTGQLPGPVQ